MDKLMKWQYIRFVENMNEYDKLIIQNGCSPAWLTDMIPEDYRKWFSNLVSGDFKKPCNEHDIRYWIGCTEHDRKQADKIFYKEMKRLVPKKYNFWFRWRGYFKAWRFYRLVRAFGDSAFSFNDVFRSHPSVMYRGDREKQLVPDAVWINGRWWTRKEAIKLGLIVQGV